MEHRVTANETLWDLAQRYGVTMKSMRAVNGIPPTQDVIVPGQVLILPIQAIDRRYGSLTPVSHMDSNTTALSAASTTSAPPVSDWLWSGPGTAVQHATISELSSILDPPSGTNPPEHDTVVIAYMPDCRHCQELEPVVRSFTSLTIVSVAP
jgi:hypothetical protein